MISPPAVHRAAVPLSLDELARRCGGTVQGDPNLLIERASDFEQAGPGAIVFALTEKLLEAAEASGATAILAPETGRDLACGAIHAANVRLAWARILEALYPPAALSPGVHPTAVLDPTADVADSAEIGPLCVVGAGAVIGARCRLEPGVIIGAGALIGADTVLQARVVIGDRCVLGQRNLVLPGAIVGGEGFGFAKDGERYHRIPQIGIVRTGDDVEIGANTTIDRASLGETVIGDGVKIDNQVQVAHNVSVGSHTVFAAQVGVAGSVTIGSRVVLGGQVGIADHVTIADRAILTGKTGVMGDVAPGSILAGYPARPNREHLKIQAVLHRLPELVKKLDSLDRAEAADRGAVPGTREEGRV